MIPLKLALRNFLCYGDNAPTLDLEGVHVACLCGQNGHGKSALLDAMTWALWGEARGKFDDELIHYGRDEMLVDLEFLARDTRYRAIRRHAQASSRRRQGPSDLQLQVSYGDGFTPITGNSIRETQAKINQVIGMDYDTFINSAFLLQGRADEFTNKKPGPRKEVLARVLGLDRYDQFEERAKARARTREGAAREVESDLDRMRREASGKDRYLEEFEDVQRSALEVAGRLESSAENVGLLRARVEDLRHKQREREDIQRRIPIIEGDIADLQTEMASRQGRIASYQDLIDRSEEIREGQTRFQDVRSRYEELNRSRRHYDDLRGRAADLERAVDAARARLEEKIRQLEMRAAGELRPRADAATALGQRLVEARACLESLSEEEAVITGRRLHLNDLAARMGHFNAIAQQLTSEGQELRSKLNMVSNSHQAASCPLCGTELGQEGCERLSESYNQQIGEKLRSHRDNQRFLKEFESEKATLEADLPRQEGALRSGLKGAQSEVDLREREIEESRKAAQELEQVEVELAQERQRLDGDLIAPEEQKKLEDLEGQVRALGYDQQAHDRLYDDMEHLRPFEDLRRRLGEAEAGLPQEQESVTRAMEMVRRLTSDLSESREKLGEMEAAVLELRDWEERLSSAEADHRDLESKHRELFRRQVELQGDLKRLEGLEAQIDEKEAGLKVHREEQAIYQDLAQAFSKRGVQAMLIETVIPRLEEEANALLGRMTDDRMHLKLETQRERRSGRGEPIETLEIVISDEMGPRNYELFSGGEAFRINLALRIALSKVLAHRKGAPLPTLFIDEGFGTQDAVGRERILDVINAIKADFEKILVITHLEDLKEAFETRIEVQKEEAGSTFWMSY